MFNLPVGVTFSAWSFLFLLLSPLSTNINKGFQTKNGLIYFIMVALGPYCYNLVATLRTVPALFWTSSSNALGCMDFVLLRRPTISGVTACSGITTGKSPSDTRFPLCRQLSTHRTDTRWMPFLSALSLVVFLPSLKICKKTMIQQANLETLLIVSA